MPPPRKPGSAKDLSKDRADSKKNVTQEKARLAAEQAERTKAAWIKKNRPAMQSVVSDAEALEKAFRAAAAALEKAQAAEKARQAKLKAEIAGHKSAGTLTATVGAAIKVRAEKEAQEFEEERKRRESTMKGLLKNFDGAMKKLSGTVEEGTKTGVLVDPGGKLPPPPKPPGTLDFLQVALWAGAIITYVRHLMKRMK
jgi:hypothetical protein